MHHLTFTESLVSNIVKRRLRIQQEMHFMDVSPNSTTHANIQDIFKRTDLDVCKALIGHYKKLVAETEVQQEGIEKAIAQHLSQASPAIRTSIESFQALRTL